MRIRWHNSWLFGLALGACSLNPQPDLPAGSEPAAVAGTSSGGASSSGGAAFGVDTGGSDVAIGAGAGTGTADHGCAGQSEDEGGAGGLAEGGAGGESGAAQLAPRPAK
jgi:hypothetical protein